MKKEFTQKQRELETASHNTAAKVLCSTVEFLKLFMPVTLAKRLVAIVLLGIGVSVKDSAALLGTCEKTMNTLQKQMQVQSVSELMVIKNGSGRKSKSNGIEKQILAELESNDYHTRQEIADMVEEKFQVKMSRSSVGRLLKKTASGG